MELKELCRLALATRATSLEEQLLHDEGFPSEVREIFEQGVLSGKFPALSKALSDYSDKEKEDFFSFKVAIALRSLVDRKEPWDKSTYRGNMEFYRESLYDGMVFAFDDLRKFAGVWLEELLRVGYHGVGMASFDDAILKIPIKQQVSGDSSIPDRLGIDREAYPVFFENTRQVLWLELNGRRSYKRDYREVGVSAEPLRTDKAILAALTALEGRPMDVERLRKALPELKLPLEKAMWEQWAEAWKDVPMEQRFEGKRPELIENLQHQHPLDYVLLLLRYYRPGFNNLPQEEKHALIEQTCAQINEFLESLRKLMAFLEYGVPDQALKAATRDPDRDVKAAVLKDVDGLTYRQIGEELGVPPPKDFADKGDHATVRQMVRRGRTILERTLGKVGWQKQIQAMKDEAKRYRSLSEMEQRAEDMAEYLRIPYEEALERAREEEARIREQSESSGKPEND